MSRISRGAVHKVGNESGTRRQARTSPAKRRSDPAHQEIAGLHESAGNKAVDTLLGEGKPLEPGVRAGMEARFGESFVDVRVHDGEAAHRSATDLEAKAYTIGNDIAFSAERYAPQHGEGRQLIAHELAHVVQQSRAGPLPPSSDGTGALEQDASRAADAVVSGGRVQVATASAVGVAADPEDKKRKRKPNRQVNVDPTLVDAPKHGGNTPAPDPIAGQDAMTWQDMWRKVISLRGFNQGIGVGGHEDAQKDLEARDQQLGPDREKNEAGMRKEQKSLQRRIKYNKDKLEKAALVTKQPSATGDANAATLPAEEAKKAPSTSPKSGKPKKVKAPPPDPAKIIAESRKRLDDVNKSLEPYQKRNALAKKLAVSRPRGGGARSGIVNNTYAVIQVIDPDGKVLASAAGYNNRNGHAEENAIRDLRAQLAKNPNANLEGARIEVFGDQVVCTDVCKPALQKLAHDLGIKDVVGMTLHETKNAGAAMPPDADQGNPKAHLEDAKKLAMEATTKDAPDLRGTNPLTEKQLAERGLHLRKQQLIGDDAPTSMPKSEAAKKPALEPAPESKPAIAEKPAAPSTTTPKTTPVETPESLSRVKPNIAPERPGGLGSLVNAPLEIANALALIPAVVDIVRDFKNGDLESAGQKIDMLAASSVPELGPLLFALGVGSTFWDPANHKKIMRDAYAAGEFVEAFASKVPILRSMPYGPRVLGAYAAAQVAVYESTARTVKGMGEAVVEGGKDLVEVARSTRDAIRDSPTVDKAVDFMMDPPDVSGTVANWVWDELTATPPWMEALEKMRREKSSD
jgi:hypothetical protein